MTNWALWDYSHIHLKHEPSFIKTIRALLGVFRSLYFGLCQAVMH